MTIVSETLEISCLPFSSGDHGWTSLWSNQGFFNVYHLSQEFERRNDDGLGLFHYGCGHDLRLPLGLHRIVQSTDCKILYPSIGKR